VGGGSAFIPWAYSAFGVGGKDGVTEGRNAVGAKVGTGVGAAVYSSGVNLGHLFVLHNLSWMAFLSHSTPKTPFDKIFLCLLLVPPPQVLEHGLNGDHDPILQPPVAWWLLVCFHRCEAVSAEFVVGCAVGGGGVGAVVGSCVGTGVGSMTGGATGAGGARTTTFGVGDGVTGWICLHTSKQVCLDRNILQTDGAGHLAQ
jgi:hypothetical protein